MFDMFLVRWWWNRVWVELGWGKSIMMNVVVKFVEKGEKEGGRMIG